MNQTLEKLHDLEKNGYQIDFGNVFNHAFENYKKIALYAGLVLLIFIILFVVFTTVSLVSILGATAMSKEFSPENFKIENLSQSNLLALGIFSTLSSCLLSPFQAAFLKMAHHGDRDEDFPVSSLFSYYKILVLFLDEFVVSKSMRNIINRNNYFSTRVIFRLEW